MILEASKFTFTPASQVSRARRVLIKPCVSYPLPHPVTTSWETVRLVIEGIRRVSDADILILEGAAGGGSIYEVYKALGYYYPRVLMLDVRDCIWVEVENPLPQPFAVPTFWIPNVVLASDYLISIAPFKVLGKSGCFTVKNLLSLLPVAKYRGEAPGGWGTLYKLGIDKVIADLYFTLPFDLGIVDGWKKFIGVDDPTLGEVEEYGKIFIGEPFEVDKEASEIAGLTTEYLELIEAGRLQLEG